jgi:carbon-monoxide dehydrogenase medium subunit
MVHDAIARIRGPEGVREVPVTDLFLGFFETVLDEGELLEAVHVPPVPSGLRSGYLKFLPRTKDDYPTVSVAAGLAVEDGRVTDVRLAVAGGGSTTLRCSAAADALVGELEPISDGRGSARYKTEMARVSTRRLLDRLLQEAAA